MGAAQREDAEFRAERLRCAQSISCTGQDRMSSRASPIEG